MCQSVVTRAVTHVVTRAVTHVSPMCHSVVTRAVTHVVTQVGTLMVFRAVTLVVTHVSHGGHPSDYPCRQAKVPTSCYHHTPIRFQITQITTLGCHETDTTLLPGYQPPGSGLPPGRAMLPPSSHQVPTIQAATRLHEYPTSQTTPWTPTTPPPGSSGQLSRCSPGAHPFITRAVTWRSPGGSPRLYSSGGHPRGHPCGHPPFIHVSPMLHAVVTRAVTHVSPGCVPLWSPERLPLCHLGG
jgi:hypothetical protein